MINFADFRRPLRYLGREWNLPKKDFKSARYSLRICLCFPELYEVGMSSLGFNIVYRLLNSFDNTACERCFLPAEDLRDFLIDKNIELFSLESKTPLREFDALGFTINSELNFINFLWMLYLAKIPLAEKQRKRPLVIVGGLPNPEPLSAFVDAFYLGEFEPQAGKFVNILSSFKNSSKEQILENISQVEGFYAPSFFSLRKGPKGYNFSAEEDKKSVFPVRVFARDINKIFIPRKPLVPYIQTVHDRAVVEISRGCPNRCKFCQARAIYSPYRQRDEGLILSLIEDIYYNTGYESMSLLGLSTVNHSQINSILDRAVKFSLGNKIKLSLPSLRLDKSIGTVLEKFLPLSSGGITIAVEAASERLRTFIAKEIDISALEDVAKIFGVSNFTTLKLYFMAGLPSETKQDVWEIPRLVKDFYYLCRRASRRKIQFNISISCFMPKPFSRFERERMEDIEELEDKIKFLRKEISRIYGVRFIYPDIGRQVLETILSRGDRNIALVIEDVFWNLVKSRADYRDNFTLYLWDKSFDKFNIDRQQYLGSYKFSPSAWAHLSGHKGL